MVWSSVSARERKSEGNKSTCNNVTQRPTNNYSTFQHFRRNEWEPIFPIFLFDASIVPVFIVHKRMTLQ